MSVDVIPEFSAQSKFQFVDAPLQQFPMKCASCYRYDTSEPEREGRLKFIDWNLEIEFYGKIFICVDCLREMVNQLGWATETQVKRARNQISDLIDQVSMLSEENAVLRDAVGNLSTIAVGGAIPGGNLMVGLEPGKLHDGGEGSDSQDPIGTTKKLRATDEEPDGSADESGSTDLRDDDELSRLLDEI